MRRHLPRFVENLLRSENLVCSAVVLKLTGFPVIFENVRKSIFASVTKYKPLCKCRLCVIVMLLICFCAILS